MKRFSSTWIIVGVMAIGCALVGTTHHLETSASAAGTKKRVFLYPPSYLKNFTFGYGESIADSLWIRVIQDIDVCESLKTTSPKPNGDGRVPRCEEGWVYHMLAAITDVAPRFKMPYRAGALMLNVTVDDIEGARLIFERGLERFPNDWQLLYNSAYHYIGETRNYSRAAELLVRAGKNGAPPWVFSLAGRLLTEEGRWDLAESVLTDAIKSNPEGPGSERIKKRLDEIQKERANKK